MMRVFFHVNELALGEIEFGRLNNHFFETKERTLSLKEPPMNCAMLQIRSL